MKWMFPLSLLVLFLLWHDSLGDVNTMKIHDIVKLNSIPKYYVYALGSVKDVLKLNSLENHFLR